METRSMVVEIRERIGAFAAKTAMLYTGREKELLKGNIKVLLSHL